MRKILMWLNFVFGLLNVGIVAFLPSSSAAPPLWINLASGALALTAGCVLYAQGRKQ